MVDISLCESKDCPMYNDGCDRNPKNHYVDEWQSWIAPDFNEQGCDLRLIIHSMGGINNG